MDAYQIHPVISHSEKGKFLKILTHINKDKIYYLVPKKYPNRNANKVGLKGILLSFVLFAYLWDWPLAQVNIFKQRLEKSWFLSFVPLWCPAACADFKLGPTTMNCSPRSPVEPTFIYSCCWIFHQKATKVVPQFSEATNVSNPLHCVAALWPHYFSPALWLWLLFYSTLQPCVSHYL